MTEDILDIPIHGNPIGRTPFRSAANVDHVSVDVHRCAGEFRADAQHAVIVCIEVKGVIEIDKERCQRRAFVLIPGTAVIIYTQRRVGLKAETLLRLGDQWSLS